MDSISYGYGTTVSGDSIEAVVERVTAALGDVGFGVLTRIDVHTTFKAKLDVEHRPYTILGACNPGLAQRALADEPHVGLLMPCNVVVQASDGGFDISIIDAHALKPLLAPGSAALGVMDEADALLREALATL
jgi:uncharacterized protein (DUF302 family)